MQTIACCVDAGHQGLAVFDFEGDLGSKVVPEVLSHPGKLVDQGYPPLRKLCLLPDADPMAVVDQYCNVKGVQGLSVVDASIMPRIPRSGGCHATVLMIGERAVAFIEAALHQPTGV